jgi:hypothetical protein
MKKIIKLGTFLIGAIMCVVGLMRGNDVSGGAAMLLGVLTLIIAACMSE